jgi:hypothetical protein
MSKIKMVIKFTTLHGKISPPLVYKQKPVKIITGFHIPSFLIFFTSVEWSTSKYFAASRIER